MKFVSLLALVLLLAGGAAPLRAHSSSSEPVPEPPPFDTWLAEFMEDAAARGISRRTLDSALDGVEPIPRVIELDRKQPEYSLTYKEYVTRVAPDGRVKKGRQNLARNRAPLDEVSRIYGVPPQVIVALWGVETDFGRLTGGFNVIPALVTLAHDRRRSDFFRKELINALTIVDEGHISADAMLGSWAGAMGQCQFMPSSFLNYAVDRNRDGRKDIWTTPEDIFASAANLLVREGWIRGRTWGRLVRLPKEFDLSLEGLETRKPLPQWSELGIRRADGRPLPRVGISASLLMPDGPGGPAFLVYENFRVIMRWNRSKNFALTVGYLADIIAGKPGARPF